MYWKKLDVVESGLYKGIAILMIVTHNFMHLFPVPKENEFGFYPERIFDLFHLVVDEPGNIIRGLLSFFGHFGVQVFVFLSAYGLTKKYLHHQIHFWEFIKQRGFKIYPAFILAILAWSITVGWVLKGGEYGVLGPVKVLWWNLSELALKLSLVSNFVPGMSLHPVGPWWFIPFIFQFYFSFPGMLYLYSRWKGSVLLLISTVGVALSAVFQGEIGGLNIYFTLLGHLPEFCLGIYLAGRDDVPVKVPALLIVSSLVVYILGNFYELFWYVNHVSFLVILLAVFSYVVPFVKKNDYVKKGILFFGMISLPLFLVNGFLRDPFLTWAKDADYWLLTIALCVLSLAVSVIVALLLFKIEGWLKSRVSAKRAEVFSK